MSTFENKIIENLNKIMIDRGLNQKSLSALGGITPSQWSKIINNRKGLTIDRIEEFATNLQMSVIDLYTYPDKYININQLSSEGEKQYEPKVILQIELKEDKKEQVMKLVFGENNLEILNK